MTTHITLIITINKTIREGHPSFFPPEVAFCLGMLSIKNLALAVDAKNKILDKFIHINLKILMGSNIRIGKLGHRIKYKGSQFTNMP